MTRYDVFNGDADGICALHQLRLAKPAESELVTGVKRDIQLLDRVDAGIGDEVTVLDVSLDKNRAGLERVLEAGASVLYVDHHFAGEIPQHPSLRTRIDTSPETCTSLLMDDYLDGAFRLWAVTGAYGDNFDEQARERAAKLGLGEDELESVRELGILINYNGYGVALEDLFFPPQELYRRIRPYADPRAFIRDDPAFTILRDGYAGDMEQAESLRPVDASAHGAVFLLPDAPWARRVAGVLGNDLARRHPERAHAMLTELPGGSYRISVRAPLSRRSGADELCRSFPSGGGRAAAAGINELPAERYDEFVSRFQAQFAA